MCGVALYSTIHSFATYFISLRIVIGLGQLNSSILHVKGLVADTLIAISHQLLPLLVSSQVLHLTGNIDRAYLRVVKAH